MQIPTTAEDKKLAGRIAESVRAITDAKAKLRSPALPLAGGEGGLKPAVLSDREITVAEVRDDDAPPREALAAVWARTKIADLADRAIHAGGDGAADATRDVALEYGLVSAYTAFVAVDALTRTAGTHGTTVAVSVPVPVGVKYETTVGE
ncbi:MAG: hypothetical protein ACE5F9_10090 [Phycisphaerae bacterium]